MGEDGCCGGHCGCEDGKGIVDCDEELTTEDLAESNNIILSALIEVLVKKGLLTQDELDAVVEEIASDGEEEYDEEADGSEEEGEISK